MSFYCIREGTYDQFKRVVVGCRLPQSGGKGFARMEKVMEVREARRLAKSINNACDIIEADQRSPRQ